MKNNPASALLLSFFMMTMLILVAISVSVLVIHDVRTVQTVVAGTQSYYAAEGMSELGLETVKNNLPGYEPVFDDYNFTSTSTASMIMNAREATVPCEYQSDEGWRALGLNESVQLPLFAQTNEEGLTEKVTQFYVEFYVGDEAGEPVFPTPELDVLRWKILGLYDASTVALSEYIPLDDGHFMREDPSIFGTADLVSSLGLSVPTGYSYGKFFEGGYPAVFHSYWSISRFLADNSYNYLVLTNVVQSGSDEIIYFQLHSDAVEAVCEYTQMASDADTDLGSARRELVTLVKEGENLPVFDFVLYHTEDDEAEEEESSIPIFEVSSVNLPW